MLIKFKIKKNDILRTIDTLYDSYVPTLGTYVKIKNTLYFVKDILTTYKTGVDSFVIVILTDNCELETQN